MPLDPNIALNAQMPKVQSPFEMLGDIQRLRVQQQAIQQGQALEQQRRQEIARRQQQEQAEAFIGQALQGSYVTTPEGVTTYDREKFTTQLRNSPYASILPTILPKLDAMDASFAKVAQARNEALADIGAAIDASGNTPFAVQHAVDIALKNRIVTPEQVKPYLEQIQQNPDSIKQISTSLMALSPKTRQTLEERQKPLNVTEGSKFINPVTKEVIAEGAPKPDSYQEKEVLLDGTPALVSYNPKTRQFLDASGQDVSAKVKPIPPRPSTVVTGPGSTGALTPEGVEYAATQYRVTGVMPPMGMGNSQARAAIINEAAKQTKELGQIPAIAIQKQAAFSAGKGALSQMVKMRAAAEAYETKATAQADIVEELSGKVGRTASPMLNNWWLAGKAEIAGDSDTSRLYNAITTFSTEYAKIMEGSFGSVAASSDAARKAAEKLIKASMNPKTLSDVVGLMKREMRLTGVGYDATINHLTESMGGKMPEPEPANVTEWVLENGKLVKKVKKD